MMPIAEEWLMIIDEEAGKRTAKHEGASNQRVLGPEHDRIGLLGEAQFGYEFGQPLVWSRLEGGDRGIDFTIPLRFTVDVKTFRRPDNLLVECGKVLADIYVLAGYLEEAAQAELLGWEWATVVRRAPVADFGGGFNSHYIARAELRAMDELDRRMMRLR
jgi:hypothetical protein